MESINISFTVTGQDLMGDCPFLCASNTVSYIIAEFDLDDNWKEFDSVRAIWRTDSECISTVLDNNGNCNVPQEVLKRKNEVIVNLVGSVVEDNELTERLTTYPVVALIVDATALICGTETAEITPSQFEQYVAQVIAEVEKVTGMTAVAVPLPEGSDPTASYEDGVLTLGIPKGEKGDTGNGIERVEFNSDYSLTFYFTEGEPYTTPSIRGERGAQGYGIVSVEKIGSVGLVDTYQVNYENPEIEPTTFTVTNGAKGDTGNGIASIAKIGTVGLVDTYRITFTNGGHYDFTVTNGEKGDTGETGNGIDRIELTDTTGAVKTYTIYFTDGTTTTFEVTDGEVTNAVLDEATIVQTNTDNVPYLFRPSGGDVRTGRKEFDTIVGGTVGANQLAHNFIDRSETLGITIVADNTNGTIRVSGTATSTNNLYFQQNIPLVGGHKYLLAGAKPNSGTHGLQVNGFSAKDTGSGAIIAVTASYNHNFVYGFVSGDTIDVTIHPQLIDLTAMFGSTIADYVYTLEQGQAGAGVAWLRANAPQLFEYHAYDAGSLVSVSGLTSHDMVGFNQWDEEWELGDISGTTGEPSPASAYFRTTNFTPIISGANYYFKVPGRTWIHGYDADKNYIRLSSAGYRYILSSTLISFPNEVKYIKFVTGGTVYNNDICINLSDASLNGTYKPYNKHSYLLDSTLTLRGIPKLDANNNLYYDGDRYNADGSVDRRYGIVDLGTLSWGYVSAGAYPYMASSSLQNVKFGSDNRYVANIICSSAVIATAAGIRSDGDFGIAVSNSGEIRYASNTIGTDPSAFKTAMSGVYLVYELATPTTETADPYTNPQIVNPNGTEEYVGSPIPVGHETDYPMTLTDTMPTANGTYTLNLTVANGKRSVSWT